MHKRVKILVLFLLAGITVFGNASEKQKLVLVDKGIAKAKIIIFKDAPPFTRKAANELAEYIQKISGAKLDIIEGKPDPVPEHAIWVGYQPVLKSIFPKVDFNFKHPEEILISANSKHLLIVGRDKWDPKRMRVKGKRETINGVQAEYGTVNAVYTFLQDFLDVRWLWPGKDGIDVIEKKTIAFSPFTFRYHPPFRSRANLFMFARLLKHSAYGQSSKWSRLQRLQLDSLYIRGDHAFKKWWDRYHKTNPEYFALQPDGTRAGGDKAYPRNTLVKLCMSNPDVWKRWIEEDVPAQLKVNAMVRCFNVSPNDSYGVGQCVCKRCLSWDHPKAELRPFYWKNMSKRAVALSDREIQFANQCARLLKKKYPNKDYSVVIQAYGNSRPAPLKTVPDDNVIISNVANMFWNVKTPDKDSKIGKAYSTHYADWSKLTKNQAWRPNTGNPCGWQNAFADIPITRTMESFDFAVKHGCIGITVDSIGEHWATQGPLFYVLTLKSWNPSLDWRAVLDDYYKRGFGPASATVKQYWTLLEESRNRKVDKYPGEANGYEEVYNQVFFNKAAKLLQQAKNELKQSPKKYLKRIEFLEAGLRHMQMICELRRLSLRMVGADFKDEELNNKVRGKWNEIKANAEKNAPAIYWPIIRPGSRMVRGGLFHPDQKKGIKKKHVRMWKNAAIQADKQYKLNKDGWELIYSDNFDDGSFEKNWQVLSGKWSTKSGALRGKGAIISKNGFPGDNAPAYMRVEFDLKFEEKNDKISKMPELFKVAIHIQNEKEKDSFGKTGYTFQIGPKEKMMKISKQQKAFTIKPKTTVRMGSKTQNAFVVQNDSGVLTLKMKDKLVLEHKESSSIMGNHHDRIGFKTPFRVKIDKIRIYIKRMSEGLDLE